MKKVLIAVLFCGCGRKVEIAAKSGEVVLPKGEFKLSAPLVIEGAKGLLVKGSGTRLIMNFEGPAALIIRGSKSVQIEDITITGNRASGDRRFGLPPSDQSMARWNQNNGILVESSDDVLLEKLTIREVVSYPVLVSASKNVTVREVFVADSGSLNAKGANNATGGILFEEGCERFAVERCRLRNIRGNGIWTHSLYKSPRNKEGRFEGNEVRFVGRDALQAGHATGLRIVGNRGAFVGFPTDIVDMEAQAVPVVLDTAGDVDNSEYSGNQFEEVNGKCIDLDGFHDGVIRANQCVNNRVVNAYPHSHFGIVLNNSNPDMESKNIQIVSNVMEGFRYGGLFLIGSGHVVRDNVFRKINQAKAEDQDLLRSGIYFAAGAHRPSPAAGNTVENNVVEGYKMDAWCVGYAPGLKANTVRNNKCAAK